MKVQVVRLEVLARCFRVLVFRARLQKPIEKTGMVKSKILILEDDINLSQVLSDALKAEGFEIFLAAKPEAAFEILKNNSFSFIIVDCLLPQMTGVDFVVKAKKDQPNIRSQFLLMSGVFTDKGFVKDALQKTGATHFLKKPFEVSELLEKVAKVQVEATNGLWSPRLALYQLFNKPKATNREKRKAIEQLDEVDGFDLPFIFSLLVETHTTGHLNVVREDREIFGVSFADGKIVNVDVNDQESYVGKLLVDKGLLTPQELEMVLKDNSPRRIGQKLIEDNLISPHAFDVILAEQMNIRLSKTIQKGGIKTNFVASDVEHRGPEIDSEALLTFLHDWIVSKIPLSWLKAQYRPWGDHVVKMGATFGMTHPVLKTPLLSGMPQFIQMITAGKSLNQIFDQPEYSEEQIYKALHFLFTTGLLIFDEKVSAETETERLNRLKKLASQFKSKSHFDIFELMGGRKNSKDTEISWILEEFIRSLGPDPSSSQNKSLTQVYKEVVDKARETCRVLLDKDQRGEYERELNQVEAQRRIKIQNSFEEAKACLSKGQMTRALELLQSVGANTQLENIKLYLVWARLGTLEQRPDRVKLLKEIDFELLQVPPEEKYGALFSFVQGLYFKTVGQYGQARKCFQKCIQADPHFLVAKRELHAVSQAEKKKNENILNMNLGAAIGSFFKRKKDSA